MFVFISSVITYRLHIQVSKCFEEREFGTKKTILNICSSHFGGIFLINLAHGQKMRWIYQVSSKQAYIKCRPVSVKKDQCTSEEHKHHIPCCARTSGLSCNPSLLIRQVIKNNFATTIEWMSVAIIAIIHIQFLFVVSKLLKMFAIDYQITFVLYLSKDIDNALVCWMSC